MFSINIVRLRKPVVNIFLQTAKKIAGCL